MSNKNIDHKQLIVAKCYELAMLQVQITKEYGATEVDYWAADYLDRIMKAANTWEEAESSAKSEKDSYERNR